MAILRMSSLVFVGGQFPVELFDERALFDGDLDQGGQIRLGPIGQFSYLSGTYRFEVTPPRIDLKHNGSCIIPEALVKAATAIAEIIEPVRKAATVSGFGMNCDTIYDRTTTGVNGVDFCSRLVNQRLAELAGGASIESMARVRFADDLIQYDVRFEPHVESGGENLLVAVNGHQALSDGDDLNPKLRRGLVQKFREYIRALERRIVDSVGSV